MPALHTLIPRAALYQVPQVAAQPIAPPSEVFWRLIPGPLWQARCTHLICGKTTMNLHEGLDEISFIRVQLARATRFKGYSPLTVGFTGVLAAVIALLQSSLSAASALSTSLLVWVAAGAVCGAGLAIDTVGRSRRVHPDMALQMVHAACERLLPPVAAAVLLTWSLWYYAPREIWMLPGLWQMLYSLGVFASVEFLPRSVFLAGVWYLCSGMVCLASARGTFSPWQMGIPFCVGQLLTAVILQQGYRDLGKQAC
jgi:hypothetical protein